MMNQPMLTINMGGTSLLANDHLLGYPLLINHGLIHHGLPLLANIDIENGHRNSVFFPLNMMIFHSYVRLPERKSP